MNHRSHRRRTNYNVKGMPDDGLCKKIFLHWHFANTLHVLIFYERQHSSLNIDNINVGLQVKIVTTLLR